MKKKQTNEEKIQTNEKNKNIFIWKNIYKYPTRNQPLIMGSRKNSSNPPLYTNSEVGNIDPPHPLHQLPPPKKNNFGVGNIKPPPYSKSWVKSNAPSLYSNSGMDSIALNIPPSGLPHPGLPPPYSNCGVRVKNWYFTIVTCVVGCACVAFTTAFHPCKKKSVQSLQKFSPGSIFMYGVCQ